jgi:hypothetical protein
MTTPDRGEDRRRADEVDRAAGVDMKRRIRPSIDRPLTDEEAEVIRRKEPYISPERMRRFTWDFSSDVRFYKPKWTLNYATSTGGSRIVRDVADLLTALAQRHPDADPVEKLREFIHSEDAIYMPAELRADLVAHGEEVEPEPPHELEPFTFPNE